MNVQELAREYGAYLARAEFEKQADGDEESLLHRMLSGAGYGGAAGAIPGALLGHAVGTPGNMLANTLTGAGMGAIGGGISGALARALGGGRGAAIGAGIPGIVTGMGAAAGYGVGQGRVGRAANPTTTIFGPTRAVPARDPSVLRGLAGAAGMTGPGLTLSALGGGAGEGLSQLLARRQSEQPSE
jgi:hypothetical protein